jgi:hypothetical protein
MIEVGNALPGVFARMDVMRARCIMVIAARRGEGASTLSRAIAEAAARRAKRAALLLDLDVERDEHFRHYAKRGEALQDFRSGAFGGASFFRVIDKKGAVPNALDRFLVVRVGEKRMFVSHFERAGLSEGARTRVAPSPDYWAAARARADYVIVDAPAREDSLIGVEAAPSMDGVVIVVSGAGGSAAQSLALKQELTARGAPILGLVYTEADRAVAWLERWFSRARARTEAAP